MDWTEVPNPQPDRHYYWANSMDKTSMARLTRPRGSNRGYTIEGGATREEAIERAELLGYNEFMVDGNNRVAYAELVLCSCSQEDYDRRVIEALNEDRRLRGDLENAYMANLEGIRGVTPLKINEAEFALEK
jgi:hypothetical protein